MRPRRSPSGALDAPSSDHSRMPTRRRRSLAVAWDSTKAGLDFIAHNLPRAHHFFVRVNPYPRPWHHVRLIMRDGAELAAWHVAGRPNGPAVVMVPGTFQTKDDTRRKRRAIDLWRRLGAHVLILDMRGFGGSSAWPSTVGQQEPRDILEAALWLRQESGATKVALWGESLGGAECLVAAALPEAAPIVSQVIAWSPFADIEDASRVSSKGDKRGKTAVGSAYRFLLRRRTARRANDFHSYLQLRADEIGIPVEELVKGASPLTHLHDLRVPVSIVHAEDDPIVPVAHAHKLRDVGAERVVVQVAPKGGHLRFDVVAPEWYADYTRSLFE